MKPTWEYTALKIPMDFSIFSGTDFDAGQVTEQLNALGAEGWELVSTCPVQQARGDTAYVCALLKRQVFDHDTTTAQPDQPSERG
jgi:hypothetical protein